MTPVTDSFDCHGIWFRLLIQPKLLSTFEFEKFHLEYLLNIAISDGLRLFTSEFENSPAQQAKQQVPGNNISKPQRNPLILTDGSEKEFQEKKLANIRYLTLCVIILLKYDNDKLVHILTSRQLEFVLLSLLKIYEVDTYPIEFRRYAILLYYRLAVSFVVKTMVSVKRKYHHVVSTIVLDQIPAEHEQYLFQRFFGEVVDLVESIEKILADENFWKFPSKKPYAEEYRFIIEKIEFSKEDVRNDLKQWSKVRNTDNVQGFPEASSNPDVTLRNKRIQLKINETEYYDGFFRRRGLKLMKRDSTKQCYEKILENFLQKNIDIIDICDDNDNNNHNDDNGNSHHCNGDGSNCGDNNNNNNNENISEENIISSKKTALVVVGSSTSKTKKPRYQYYSQTDLEKSLKMISGLKVTEFESDDSFVPIRLLKSENKNLSEAIFNKFVFLLKKSKIFSDESKFVEARIFLEQVKKDKKSLSSSYIEFIDAELIDIDIRQYCEKYSLDDSNKRSLDSVKSRCVTFLKNHSDDVFKYQREIVEKCCHFLMEFDEDCLKDFCKDKNPFIKFAACLCQPLTGPENKNKCLEVWNVALGFLSATRSSASRTTLTQSQNEYFSFIAFLKQISSLKLRIHIATMFAKFFNILRNNSMSGSINFNSSYAFPETIINSHKRNIDTREFSIIFSELIRHYLNGHYNATFLQMYGEFLVAEDVRNSDQAFNYFLRVLYIKTNGFSNSDFENYEDLITQLINCSSKARYHVRAAYFYQFLAVRNLNCYSLAFKELSQENSNDSLGTYLEYIWDVTYLEWLHSNPRFETHFGDRILELIRLPELNESNIGEVRKQAISARVRGFFNLLLESSTV